jgi:hypothetical protein
MKDSDNAFPVLMTHGINDGLRYLESGGAGMTLPVYAAIHLKVPQSGDPELDAMIRESRRADFAEAALAGITAKVYKTKDYNGSFIFEDIANEARVMADAMLAEWEKEVIGDEKA